MTVTERTLGWVDQLIWILIYGGLAMVALGVATHGAHLVAGWSLGVLGALAAVAGVVLIGVRARLVAAPVSGAQSTAPTQRDIP